MSFQAGLFKEKTAVVTGGTQGLGRGVAEALARLGARVIAVGLPSAEPPPAGVEVATLDVTQAEDVAAFAATLERVDILINCAGVIFRLSLIHI